MKVYACIVSSLLLNPIAKAAVQLDPAPLSNQDKLVTFANFFQANLNGKVFISANKDRPYQDKIIDYEYDVSYFGLQLDPNGGLTFKSTYNIKRYIYSLDSNGRKTGVPVLKQNSQTTQCALRQMTRTTQALSGHCEKIADNSPNASILGLTRQLRILDLTAERLVWKDNSVGYLEGFLLDKAGYAPQGEVQIVSFTVKAEGETRRTLMNKKVSTYAYDLEKDQMGSLLTETTSESLSSLL